MDIQLRSTIILTVTLVVVVVALVIGAAIHFSRASQYKKGVLGLNQVQKLLGRYSSLHRFKLLNDVTLSDGKNPAHADHVLIGYFGVILFQNVQGLGEYFGDDSLDYWNYINEKGEKQKIASPHVACVKAEEVFHNMLAHAEIYNVQTESYIILSGDPEKTMYNGRKNPKILTVPALKKLLSHSKYEKDNQLDIDKIAALLSR